MSEPQQQQQPQPSPSPRQLAAGAPGKKRRRAAKACLSCRARKVRCDVLRSGPPCMNCSLDAIPCVVKSRKPKASNRSRVQPVDNTNATASLSPEEAPSWPKTCAPADDATTADPSCSTLDRGGSVPDNETTTGAICSLDHMQHQDESSAVMDFSSRHVSASSASPSSKFQALFDATPPGLGFTAPTGMATASLPYNNDNWPFITTTTTTSDEASAHITDAAVPRHHHHHHHHHRSCLHPNTVLYTHYPFLTLDNLANCPTRDVDFLEAEGCFHLPTRPILDQIVRRYFMHVHPLLPLCNEGDFWDMYCGRGDSSNKMSLLVFQAIIFASCNFVNWSLESAKSFGYSSIRSLRATFYRRCKLLYDFGAESSPVAISQAALLLSYWTPPLKTDTKPNTIWLSIAIQNAKNADAPSYYTSTTSTSTSTNNNTLKRLWWCCIIRDRILPLGLRRGIQITRAHFAFGRHAPLAAADLADEARRSLVYRPDVKRELAALLARLVELCVVLTDVLQLVFPLDGGGGGPLLLLDGDDDARIRGCKEALAAWYGGGGGGGGRQHRHESVALCTHLMLTYYHSARMALYHHELQHYLAAAGPFSLSTTSSTTGSWQRICDNRRAIQDAFSCINENLRGLNQRRLVRWLPITAVAFVAFPLALQILNVHLAAAVARQPPNGSVLADVMRALHLQYDGVDWVARLVRHLVERVLLQHSHHHHHHDDTTTSPRDWAELLAVRPWAYLRLSLALDLSMSSGKFPDDDGKDFAARLDGVLARREHAIANANANANAPPPAAAAAAEEVFPGLLCGQSSELNGGSGGGDRTISLEQLMVPPPQHSDGGSSAGGSFSEEEDEDEEGQASCALTQFAAFSADADSFFDLHATMAGGGDLDGVVDLDGEPSFMATSVDAVGCVAGRRAGQVDLDSAFL